jgi:hypothetical protein
VEEVEEVEEESECEETSPWSHSLRCGLASSMSSLSLLLLFFVLSFLGLDICS